MPASPMANDEYMLDMRAVRRGFDHASLRYDEFAAVQAEIRSHLLERLDLVRLNPAVVLDVGAATGISTRALRQRYPKAQVLALDSSEGMLRAAARQQPLWRKFRRFVGDAQRLPLRAASIDLVFSNLTLAWCNDPDAFFAEARRVLRPEGLLVFTTFGPDTLLELRQAFRSVDPYTHVHRFIDMHDLGDALLRAGMSDPVMDTERLRVTYSDVGAFLRELRGSGARNATAGRRRGLLGTRAWRQVCAQLSERFAGRPLTISLEVVHGHAWRTEDVSRAAPGEFKVPLSSLRRR